MKVRKATLSILELQKTIGQWRSRKITDSTISKLLELLLGMPAYMNSEAVYPVENFYDISRSLKFKNARFLVEAVRQSGTFGLVAGANAYGMAAFYSHLWKAKEKAGGAGNLPENLPGNLPEKFPQDNGYNNYIYTIQQDNGSGDDTVQGASSTEVSSGRLPPAEKCAEKSLEAARHFFHLINRNPIEKARVFTPLIDRFQQDEGLTREEACANLVYLVNERLVPYFVGQKHFLKTSHAGRLCWLANLLESASGRRMWQEAARHGRQKRLQDLAEKRERQRENRPLGDFEWTDVESGLRFYDDPLEGMVNIPEGAPVRPAADAVWNVLNRQWQGGDKAG